MSVAATSATTEIDAKIAALGNWRGALLARIRQLIREVMPEVVEALKWRKPSDPTGVPVWSHGGILCTGEVHEGKVKLTFARAAAPPDPAGLFNTSLDAGTRRALDQRRNAVLDATVFRALIRAGADENHGVCAWPSRLPQARACAWCLSPGQALRPRLTARPWLR